MFRCALIHKDANRKISTVTLKWGNPKSSEDFHFRSEVTWRWTVGVEDKFTWKDISLSDEWPSWSLSPLCLFLFVSLPCLSLCLFLSLSHTPSPSFPLSRLTPSLSLPPSHSPTWLPLSLPPFLSLCLSFSLSKPMPQADTGDFPGSLISRCRVCMKQVSAADRL